MIFNSNYSLSRADNVLTESNAMQVVNEVYFGKTKEVLAIEQALHELRAPYIRDYDQNLNINTYTPKINRDPNKQKLQETICDAFGFSDVLIDIQASAMPNFGTQSTSFCVDLSSKKMKKALRSTKNGFRYDKSANIVFVMSCPTGMLVDADMTDAEITAGILHEIGHNFSPAIARGVYAASMFPAITWVSLIVSDMLEAAAKGNDFDLAQEISDIIAGAIMQTNVGHVVRSKWDKMITDIGSEINKQCPAIISLLGAGMTVVNMIQSAIYAFLFAVSSFIFPSYARLGVTALTKIARAISRPDGYENEKFADAFATSYGYGAELNSFLTKLRDYNYSIGAFDKYVPVFSAIMEVYMLPFTMVSSALDEHPSDAARAKHTINQLKRELANDKSLKPATKKKMQQDIKDIEALYDYHNNKMKGLPKGSDVFKLYQQTMYKILGGDIRGKFIATHVSDDIDKAYAQTRESFDVYDNKERIGIIKENTDMMKSRFKDLMDF